ncbi:MAG: acyl-CoA synthetase [Actinobacteria bacterium]|nr:acyl-CoA synthetase [Actinomycetota bacterium]
MSGSGFPAADAGFVEEARSFALGDLLRRSALRYPDKLALVAGDVRWTFSEFDTAVDRVAGNIAARGIAKGDRVAVLSHNGWEFAVVSFGLARLGAVMVPINFMLTAAEVAFILEHSGATGAFVEDSLHPVIDEALRIAGNDLSLRGWIALAGESPAADWEPIDAWVTDETAAPPAVHVADDDPLRIMYTSGTESRPKGALLSSRSLIAQYMTCIVDGRMEHDDVEVHSLPMYHCAALDCFFGPDVYLGATSVILPRPEPGLLLETIARERVTKVFCPPTVWISLLRSPEFDTTDLSSLQKGYYGASPMSVDVLLELQRRLPDVRLWNFYGQTEMAPLATVLQPEDQLSRAGAAGRAGLNVETRLVDDDDEPVPPGTVGEIVHRSPQAMVGYYADPERTAEAFRGGWFHSGDLGVMDEDGYLTVVDRKKDMIKTGGENVASREVEETIHTMPEVAEVAVFGLPDPRWIEVVCAAVVPKDGAGVTAESVRRHAQDHLAGYKVPKRIFVAESLPKNPSGKILKRELREAFLDAAVE